MINFDVMVYVLMALGIVVFIGIFITVIVHIWKWNRTVREIVTHSTPVTLLPSALAPQIVVTQPNTPVYTAHVVSPPPPYQVAVPSQPGSPYHRPY